ncbi:MAG: hypothetical protein ABIK93_04790 [candidate division WOR-3 bacterium]
MSKKQIIILLGFIITPCFCIGKESLFGQRVSCDYENNRKTQKLILHSLPTWSLQNRLNTDNSYILVKESRDGKNPFWKQAGIYGLEFIGGEIGTCLSAYFGLAVWTEIAGPFSLDPAGFKGFLIGSIVIETWYP